VVVYLHGFCSDASTVTEWAPAVQPHATLIALHGELSCAGQPGRFRWGNDIRFIDYRIQRAIRSIGTALEHELDAANVTIVGYSEGATRAESLAWLYPERYRRAVLMSAPEPPAFEKVRRSERVAVLRGGREFRRTYRLAAEHFDRAGVRSRFWELPGASHGELGPEALRVLGEVFDFVEQ
jgi:predicted esterase